MKLHRDPGITQKTASHLADDIRDKCCGRKLMRYTDLTAT